MKIVVCVRQGLDGEISPFDASAYETALRQKGAEVFLLSMGPATVKDFLVKLTRLGAKGAVLLCDKAFAGADTIATAYTLSKAIAKLQPDLVFCGRQTLVGDTGQVGPMLAEFCGLELITNAMSLELLEDRVICTTRDEGEISANLPTVVIFERINTLRLPSLRSKTAECNLLSAEDIGVAVERCGILGSPTRVIHTFENKSGRRKCKFIKWSELPGIISEKRVQLKSGRDNSDIESPKLSSVLAVGEETLDFAFSVCEKPDVVPLTSVSELTTLIENVKPDAVIWPSSSRGKAVAAMVAAKLGLGLCADCTRLEARNDRLIMYRPALSGSIIAEIESMTSPAMATVRTDDTDVADVIVAAGYGVRDEIEKVRKFADSIGAELATTRKMVDNDILPYDLQIGLTGKTKSAPVYIAVGVSGAVHHIVGMERSGTVIAINPDKNAPIFDYADYGILEEFH